MGEDTPMTRVKQSVSSITSSVSTFFKSVTRIHTREGPTPDEMRKAIGNDRDEPQKTVSNEDIDFQSHNYRSYAEKRRQDALNNGTEADTTDTDENDTGGPNEPHGIYKTVSPPPQGNTTIPDPVSDEDTESQSQNDRGYFDRRPRDASPEVSEADTTDTDGNDTDSLTITDPEDCDHDDWGKLPERRFELPGPAPRETYGVCHNCGITEYELDSE